MMAGVDGRDIPLIHLCRGLFSIKWDQVLGGILLVAATYAQGIKSLI